jgi:hypothetical protein
LRFRRLAALAWSQTSAKRLPVSRSEATGSPCSGWVTVNLPSENTALHVAPSSRAATVSRTAPALASTVEPTGTRRAAPRSS